MARPLRIEFAGALYHVMARGNARETIYRDDDDRLAFLDCLGRSSSRFDWKVWAYCLMGNHYHLLVETRRPTLSRGMREVNGVYTQTFNRRHRRVGHVLQGRYKAVLVDRDAYLLEVSRYVVLNPVRAGLCAAAADWNWSSYRAVMGKVAAPQWLAVADTLALFSVDRGVARRSYARFVDNDDALALPEVASQLYLGDEGYAERVSAQVKATSREVPKRMRARRPLGAYLRECAERNRAIQAAYASGDYTLSEIGEHFGLHYATVSRIARA